MPLSLFAPIDRWRAPAPSPEKVAWIGEHEFAHRGLHSDTAPENSPTAFAAAIARGMGIECDIQQSGDGQAMVFHDWDLDRLTGQNGAVARRSAAQLAEISLLGNADTIPTFRSFLKQVAGEVPVLIEIKSRAAMRIASLCLAVRRDLEGYRGAHAVMSFDPRVSRWFANHAPDVVRGLVMPDENARGFRGGIRRRLALWHARPDFLAYDIRELPCTFAASQRARGLPVATWTVRSADQLADARLHADAPIAEGAGIGPEA